MDQEWWTVDDDPSEILHEDRDVEWTTRKVLTNTQRDFRSTAEVYGTIRVYFKDGKPEKPRWMEENAYVRKQSTLPGK